VWGVARTKNLEQKTPRTLKSADNADCNKQWGLWVVDSG